MNLWRFRVLWRRIGYRKMMTSSPLLSYVSAIALALVLAWVLGSINLGKAQLITGEMLFLLTQENDNIYFNHGLRLA